MKNYSKILLTLSLIVLFSCRSSKEFIFLQDAANEEIMKSMPAHTSDHNLKNGDILYVSINSMSPEVNVLFNPEKNMETNGYNSFEKYTTPSGAYLYGYEIDEDGDITLPMLGKIKVSGIPVSQVESVVRKKADEFLKDAIVKVKLLNYKVTVLGEVRNPGDYYNYNNSISVLQAIAMANGNTDYSTIKKVMVVRPLPDGNKSYLLDLTTKDMYLSDAFYLEPNDYVIVQPDKNKFWQINGQAISIYLSSISILLVTYGLLFK